MIATKQQQFTISISTINDTDYFGNTIIENVETGQFLFLIMLTLSYIDDDLTNEEKQRKRS
jgi:hypothetical protein